MMQDVIASCDDIRDFNGYVNCIKDKYSSEGRDPSHITVRAFYAKLDEISEAFNSNKISNARAKNLSYDAYMNTIEAGYAREKADGDSLFNALTVIQQQQQQQRQQQQQQQIQIRPPLQTTCYKNGTYTNCTTY